MSQRAQPDRALLIADPAAQDRAIIEPMESAGFDVQAISPGDFPGREDGISPSLVVLDGSALAQLPDPGEHEQLDDAEVIVIGDAAHQVSLNGWFADGDALFLRRPLDLGYFSDLLGDLKAERHRSAMAKSGSDSDTVLDQFGLLYGSSSAMKDLFRLLRKAAASDALLCICGESGTGKELVARSVHAYSARSEHPFDGINCGALPSELVESELFGHEKGSFSGAHRAHRGLFERVGEGTLLLDEITEMPEAAQVTLLRVLETGYFRRVGGEEDIPCLARIIAATNRNPEQAMADGQLREDLFYRISQMSVLIPPLREREDDIINLARLFVRDFASQSGLACELSAAAERLIAQHGWPGNVRQLRNAIYSACRVSGGQVGPEHLPPVDATDTREASHPSDALVFTPGTSLAEAERRLILATLEHVGGDKPRAAELLGISLRTLYNRLKEYGGHR
jgi:DNA-binding NtrC family response regulator